MSSGRPQRVLLSWGEFDLRAAGLDAPQQFIFGKLRDDKHFLGARAFARQHFEAACDRY